MELEGSLNMTGTWSVEADIVKQRMDRCLVNERLNVCSFDHLDAFHRFLVDNLDLLHSWKNFRGQVKSHKKRRKEISP